MDINLDIKGSKHTIRAFSNEYTDNCMYKININNLLINKPLPVLISKPIEDDEVLNNLQVLLLNEDYHNKVVEGLQDSFTKRFKGINSKYILVDFSEEDYQFVRFKESYIEYYDAFQHEGFSRPMSLNTDNIIELIDIFMQDLIRNYGKENIVINRCFIPYFINDKLITSDIFKNITLKEIDEKNMQLVEIYDYLNKNYGDIHYIDFDLNKLFLTQCTYNKEYYYNDDYYRNIVGVMEELISNHYIDTISIYKHNSILVKQMHNLSEFLISNNQDKVLNNFDDYAYDIVLKDHLMIKGLNNDYDVFCNDEKVCNIKHNGKLININLLEYPQLDNKLVFKDGALFLLDNPNDFNVEYFMNKNNVLFFILKYQNKTILKLSKSIRSDFVSLFLYKNNKMNLVLRFTNDKISHYEYYENNEIQYKLLFADFMDANQIRKIEIFKDKQAVNHYYFDFDGNLETHIEVNGIIKSIYQYKQGDLQSYEELSNNKKVLKITYNFKKEASQQYYEDGICVKFIDLSDGVSVYERDKNSIFTLTNLRK